MREAQHHALSSQHHALSSQEQGGEERGKRTHPKLLERGQQLESFGDQRSPPLAQWVVSESEAPEA